MTTAYWICASMTVMSSYVSLGYAMVGLRVAEADVRTPSFYALARSLSLAAVATVALLLNSETFLAAAALVMILVQALDAGIGVIINDRLKIFGPAATSVLNLVALIWMLNA